MRIRYECSTRLFKHGYRQFATDGREVIEKDLQRISSFQVIEERLDRDPCTSEHGSSAVDVWIDGDQLRLHGSTPGADIRASIARRVSIGA
ncbi:MAG: hypothetical protein A3G81_00260 [Betaproteobacteria bacterium RIFCSPLOWO2_12_FULL_65_14]|nr:MAG: hypothetical protein A3G81_00260 [Betaproteobacteria bacterium RIFCSPLOWO2_12_FULL_65_14]